MVTNEFVLTIPAAVSEAGRRFGGREAYIEGQRRLNWGNVDRLARETAAGLVALGLARGDRVAICAENSIDWIVAYLGTVYAGGAGVLVYFELKQQEILEQVTRPSCRFFVLSAGVMSRLNKLPECVETYLLIGGSNRETLDKGWHSFTELPSLATAESRTELDSRAPGPDDLAALIYTSGTTGGAKGVMLTHRNFLANAHAVHEAISFSGDDRVLLVLPLHHAMPFLATVVLPAIVGACFVIENDLRRIRDRLQEHKPTVFFGVPALYEVVYRNVLARAEAEGRLHTLQAWQKRLGLVKRLTGVNLAPLLFKQVHKALGGRLRFLVSGGAALNPQTARDFFSLGLPLLQGWGMTEASPGVALQPFSKKRFLFTNYYEKRIGSVGPPVPGVEVKLIDVPDKGISVATSGEGEVLVRGDNVFKGYWQAPEATAEAFLDGWLRTGDLGRIDQDGTIWLTGRSKYVIVLDSGEKVHPDELEANLAQSDLLADVCILGRKGRDRTQVAAVVYPSLDAARARALEAGVELTEEALRRFVQADVEGLGRELAAYKRVSRIELASEPLPKTALRKVARGLIADDYTFDFATWLANAEAAPP